MISWEFASSRGLRCEATAALSGGGHEVRMRDKGVGATAVTYTSLNFEFVGFFIWGKLNGGKWKREGDEIRSSEYATRQISSSCDSL